MRVMRGVLPDAALELRAQSDLMFVDSAAGTPSTAPYGWSRTQARGRPAITAVIDGSAAGQQAQRVAQQVAQALGGVLNLRRAEAGTLVAVADASRCDLLVLPSSLAGAGVLAKLAQPALLVG